MSDSFADLWNISAPAPAKPVQPPPKLGASASLGAQPRRSQNDVFASLASASLSPSPVPSSRAVSPGRAAAAQPPKPAKPAPANGDAFSGLLSGALGAGGGAGANMTIAERSAQAERERTQREQRQEQDRTAQTSAWAGLDALSRSASVGGTPLGGSSSLAHALDDDWALGLGAPALAPQRTVSTSPRPPPPATTHDEWDLGAEFGGSRPRASAKSKASPQTPLAAKTQPQSIWDVDDLTAPPVPAASRSPPAPAVVDSVGDFDFGNREDGPANNDEDDEDDILGVLNKPAHRPAFTQPPRSPPPTSHGAPRAASPPPHILGQIVEMGFSPDQARVALSATDTGLDVEAALDALLSNGAGSDADSPPVREGPRRGGRLDRDYGEDDAPDAPPRRRTQAAPRRGSGRSAAGASGAAHETREREREAANLQEQADKLLAQASEIGLSVFSRANAFWTQGKEKVQKAYEERAKAAAAVGAGASGSGASAASGAGTPRDGRPKWMQEAVEREGEDDWGLPPKARGKEARPRFADDDEDERPEVLPPNPRSRASPQVQPEADAHAVDLFAADAPTAYVSPFRRRPAPSQISTRASPAPPAPSRAAVRAPSPLPPMQRQTVSAPASAIATSARAKAQGTERYKLGQYAAAEAAYAAALDALPEGHLLRVPLHNNRALARLKTGDHAGAVDDCSAVVALVGVGYHPAREARVTRAEDGAGVDLGDGLVKAWKRRAEAWEGREKWEEARADWETLAGREWAAPRARSEAVAGAGRCRKMLQASASAGAGAAGAQGDDLPKVKPRPKPKPAAMRAAARRGPSPPGEAVTRVREANRAAEAEDQARHELKDGVDARLLAWKSGKETNIRALIASLDTVLWPGLGLQKVGMHELVTPSQVKIRYTKAIAKLHPDKLNVNTTTLEQRMVANGVFGTLNEAWVAFKQ